MHYFGGGYGSAGSNVDKIDKYRFSDDNVSAGHVLSAAKYGLAACNSSTIGYFGGGYAADYTNVVDKYTFSNDEVAAGTVLGTARNYLEACQG
jgi:hypothetical protein